MRRLCRQITRPSQDLKRGSWFWPKTLIRGKIRQVLGDRILAFIYNLVQNLKHQIPVLKILSVNLLMLSEAGRQDDLSAFLTSNGQSPSSPNLQKDEPQDDELDRRDEESDPDREVEKPRKGIIYARVSSDKQRKRDSKGVERGSIQGQIEEMEDIAGREGIELPYDPITDEAKTGTNFDRDGIKTVFEIAKQPDISYLLVEKVDRIGRTAPETLYFIYILQSECDVTLLTSGGEQDVSQAEGLLHTTLMSLMAEIQKNLRTTKAKKERIRGFLRNKNWKCASPKIPLGYNETDDGWLEVDPVEKEIVRDLFQKFVQCGMYAETERYIDDKYGPQTLDGHVLKTLLQNWVYIGQPRVPEEWLIETTYSNDLVEPDLNLLTEDADSEINVSEEIFHQAQDIIVDVGQQSSTDEDVDGLLDFIEEFSLFAVVEGTEPATLLHHCGEPMVKDGQVDLKGRKVHRYRCRHCEESKEAKEYYRQWPRENEMDRIQLIQQVLDGNTSLFDTPK